MISSTVSIWSGIFFPLIERILSPQFSASTYFISGQSVVIDVKSSILDRKNEVIEIIVGKTLHVIHQIKFINLPVS